MDLLFETARELDQALLGQCDDEERAALVGRQRREEPHGATFYPSRASSRPGRGRKVCRPRRRAIHSSRRPHGDVHASSARGSAFRSALPHRLRGRAQPGAARRGDDARRAGAGGRGRRQRQDADARLPRRPARRIGGQSGADPAPHVHPKGGGRDAAAGFGVGRRELRAGGGRHVPLLRQRRPPPHRAAARHEAGLHHPRPQRLRGRGEPAAQPGGTRPQGTPLPAQERDRRDLQHGGEPEHHGARAARGWLRAPLRAPGGPRTPRGGVPALQA